MIALFIILGIIGWFILGILGYIIYQKFGDENIYDEFGLSFAMGAMTFCLSILLVIYERIRDFITSVF
jgi:hypothetical protein